MHHTPACWLSDRSVIERLHNLKRMTITVKAGRNRRTYPAVPHSGQDDLIFQGIRTGSPTRDNNILTRHIKPAAQQLRLDFVNWRSLRTSHATWLKIVAVYQRIRKRKPRHARASTTLDIYQQAIPEITTTSNRQTHKPLTHSYCCSRPHQHEEFYAKSSTS